MNHPDFIGQVTISLFESLSPDLKPAVTWGKTHDCFMCTVSYQRSGSVHSNTREVSFIELEHTDLSSYSRIFADHILRKLLGVEDHE